MTLWASTQVRQGALGRIRTCNLLIRSQVLYPLSYERAASRRTARLSIAAPPGEAEQAARQDEVVGLRKALV